MIPTPHITAKSGDFAKTVLMPGDPLRSKYIAENYLTNIKLINNVRGVQGYTGEYKGKRVSVMASGMGMPSMGIYAYELFNFYDVDNIIRVGSCGATRMDIRPYDLIIGKVAYTTSSFAENFGLDPNLLWTASERLVNKTQEVCLANNVIPRIGNIFSSDVFYRENNNQYYEQHDIIAVEMEAAALYMNAYKAKKNALTILTVSDSLVDLKAVNLTADQRQKTFDSMIHIALETAE